MNEAEDTRSTHAAPGPTASATTSVPPDWTRGASGIVYQVCTGCGKVWYFRRAFCPQCGAARPREMVAAGSGIVHAGTLVHRAPTDEFRALAPYRIVLVDMDEGFRMMGHGQPNLTIGDRAQCGFRPLGERVLPYFEKETNDA